MPVAPAARIALEQAELQAEVDDPGPIEPGQAVDQFVEAVVERHPAAIVAWRATDAPIAITANLLPQ